MAAIVKEFADALDREAKKDDDCTTPGSRFHHEKYPQGDWDMRIWTHYDFAFSNLMLMCVVKSTPPLDKHRDGDGRFCNGTSMPA